MIGEDPIQCCATTSQSIHFFLPRISCASVLKRHQFCRIIDVVNVRRFASDADFPGHTKVPLPALSPTMEMGSIISWEKKEGDKLNEGDLLAEIETDKATMGFETPEEGYLARIIIPAGSKDIPIGKLLCIIVENESDIAAFKDYAASEESVPVPAPKPAAKKAEAPSAPAAKSAGAPSPPHVPSQTASGRLFASPLAKKLASEQGVDLSSIAGSGSGSGGRIVSGDVARAGPAGSPGTFADIQLSGMRRTIAKRLTESKQTIPHYYLTIDAQIDELLRYNSLFWCPI